MSITSPGRVPTGRSRSLPGWRWGNRGGPVALDDDPPGREGQGNIRKGKEGCCCRKIAEEETTSVAVISPGVLRGG